MPRPALAAAMLAATLAAACAQEGGPAQTLVLPETFVSGPSSVVVISLSGLTPERYRGSSPDTPTLAALAEAGVSADAVRGVAPASSYPAHATLASGRRPAGHGVVADRLLGDEGVRAARYSKAEAVRVPTLWRLAQESGLRVATLGWPSTVGAEVDANLPDVSIRSGETWAQALQGSASPAVLARAQQAGADAPEAAGPGPARDAVIVAVACGLVASEAPPQLLLLHLSQTRPPLRSLGPSDPQTRAAFASADQEVARLLSCVQAQGRLASTAFAVVGDHGVIPVHTVVAPNAVLARAGLITPENRGSGIVAWTAISRSNGGSAFVYSRDRDEALLARRALEQEAAATGAFRIVSAQEMLRLGADPDAWFGLEAEPGYVFADPARGPVLRPAVARSGGGYLPDRPEMDAGFVAWGPGLARGVRIPAMQQTDVAPTLAPLLGFALDGAEGRVLVGILRLPRVSALPEP